MIQLFLTVLELYSLTVMHINNIRTGNMLMRKEVIRDSIGEEPQIITKLWIHH
jgi:hypothetical protein